MKIANFQVFKAALQMPLSGGTKNSNIYVCNVAFNSKFLLYLTMGHERVHVMDYYYGRLNPYNETSTKRSEIRAYNWDFMQCMKFRLQSDPYYGIKMPVETLNEYIKLENKYGYNTKMYDY